MKCDGVQKFPDARLLGEIDQIYRNYRLYHQSDGREQVVLDAQGKQPRDRSAVIIENLLSSMEWSAQGEMLDVGCGNGDMLKAYSSAMPGWKLWGHDINSPNQSLVEEVSSLEALLTGELADIGQTFDLITMVHSLEHFTAPVEALTTLRTKLKPQARLFIQVADYALHIFELCIADHILHFSEHTLTRLLQRCGYEVLSITPSWYPKELSIVAVPAQAIQLHDDETENYETAAKDSLVQKVSWLEAIIRDVQLEAARRPAGLFGIFGTSIAATWVYAAVGDDIAFFVDEDATRHGKNYHGKPVLMPDDVPSDATVYLCLTPNTARSIFNRLQTQINLLLPPEID